MMLCALDLSVKWYWHRLAIPEQKGTHLMSAFDERLGLAPGSMAEVEYNLHTGQVAWIILSGKMASGKDRLARALHLPGEQEILSYGNILRENLTLVMDYSFTWKDKEYSTIVDDVESFLHYTPEAAKDFVDYIYERVMAEGELNPYERTDYMRVLLQNMGSIWLPHQDYLPHAAAHRASLLLRQGDSVVAAGSRFLPDVEIPRLAGALTVRLDVTRETQLRRLLERDRLSETPALLKALDHPGEVALDDFPHDIRVSNDADGDDAFAALADQVNAAISSILASRRSQ